MNIIPFKNTVHLFADSLEEALEKIREATSKYPDEMATTQIITVVVKPEEPQPESQAPDINAVPAHTPWRKP